MSMKKIGIFLLVAAMATNALALTSCGGDKAKDPVTTTAPTTDTTTLEETTAGIADDLPEKDLDGYQFRVLLQQGEDRYRDMVTEDGETGDILNDIVYRRNREVEERFNVKIEATGMEYDDITKSIDKMVQSGSDDYDLFFPQMVAGAGSASSGYFYPINKLPYVNLEKPWWDKQITNAFSVGGNLYMANGDISPTSFLTTSCVAFNKKLFTDRDMAYPYDLVRDGKWTIDKMIEMTKDQTTDMNGDGKYDMENDFYGYSSWYLDSPFDLYYGCGGQLVQKDKDDIPYLDLDVEKASSIYNKIYDLVLTNRSYYVTEMNDYETTYKVFAEGRSLFCNITLEKIQRFLRDMNQDFGILPMPKNDENQENYASFVNGASSMVAVPLTVVNPEVTGLMLEALASSAYRSITPNLYDVVVKTKNVRDDDSAEMLDIAIRNRAFDMAYANGLSGVGSFVRDLLTKDSKDVASFFAKNEKAANKQLEKLVKVYTENGQ